MAEGRGRDAWQHTASLLAMLYNVNRDPKRSKALAPSDFDPYQAKKSDPAPLRVGVGVLKMFVPGMTPSFS